MHQKIIFVSAIKMGGNTANILNCYFWAKFTFWPIKLSTYMLEMKYTSDKQYLFGLHFYMKVTEDSYRATYTWSFLICPIRTTHKPSKVAAAKKFFLEWCICWRCNLLRWMCFVPCGNWKTLLFLKVFHQCEIFSTVIFPVFFKQVFERSPYFTLSPQ